jgi:hypothetical protein
MTGALPSLVLLDLSLQVFTKIILFVLQLISAPLQVSVGRLQTLVLGIYRFELFKKCLPHALQLLLLAGGDI